MVVVVGIKYFWIKIVQFNFLRTTFKKALIKIVLVKRIMGFNDIIR